MNRFKGKKETAKRGFIPQILLMEDDQDDYISYVLDNSFVEYGTGCWVDKGHDVQVAYEAQMMLWNLFVGGIPEGHFVYNNCSDFRLCYNPNCLATMEAPEYEA